MIMTVSVDQDKLFKRLQNIEVLREHVFADAVGAHVT